MNFDLDVLIPTYNRPYALAVTLTSLCSQTYRPFRVFISDQSPQNRVGTTPEMLTPMRILKSHGCPVFQYRHVPPKGMAEQRQFLLDQSDADYVLFLDDDLILEAQVFQNMMAAIREERCGFVGCAVIGLSFIQDYRPEEQRIEFWDGKVVPEIVAPGLQSWERYRLHNAANLYHVEKRMGMRISEPRRYKVAWIGGCILYDRKKLVDISGFNFWRQLPQNHSGEDVLVQLRMMKKYGGCGLIPSGVYHQELPTTIPDRQFDAPKVLNLFREQFSNIYVSDD